MSVTINFSKNTSAPWQSNANMLKSTREKIQRQEERNQSMRRKEIWKLPDSFQKQSYSRNCPTRNCRKNNRDISRLTCGHNKSRYFTDACLG